MTLLDMVRIASHDLGPDATNEDFRRFLWERFCKEIDPRFVPVYRATLRGEVQLKAAREMAARIVQEEAKSGKKAS